MPTWCTFVTAETRGTLTAKTIPESVPVDSVSPYSCPRKPQAAPGDESYPAVRVEVTMPNLG
jgi:hypothetical protein